MYPIGRFGGPEIVNPTAQELRALAAGGERTTRFGSASYVTKVRNRSAKNTYVVADGIQLGIMQQPFALRDFTAITEKVDAYLKDRTVIRLDRCMALHPKARIGCRLYVTREFARIAYMWQVTLFPPRPGQEPELTTVYVPEWPERMILVHPTKGITYILGTDYFGECKKSFLRMAMYLVKQKGWLGFHAGSKLLRVRGADGELREVGFVMFGLSGIGKTTLTVQDHGLKPPEGVAIRQDDVVFMEPSGYCYGTEAGYFFKTEGLEPTQRVLYAAATHPEAILENVWVTEDGEVDFTNYELTSNGRGVVSRSVVPLADDEIDLPRAHKLVFIIRRNDTVPPVARLSPEQAAAFFMLGESIETSAGDPTRAGQSKREVGTNPFLIGPEAEEGNRFLEILRRNPDIECFLLNTGSVGAAPGTRGEKISVPVSAQIIKEIARGGMEWEFDPHWEYQVPRFVAGVPIKRYRPWTCYLPGEYSQLVERLRRERLEWLGRFPGLDPAIPKAIECPLVNVAAG
ncbi:MAG: phosphoenolpyruvate carboxykinase (ATP) [Acetobacteraceae bacterium]|nr:phosphoenolpyruvate carboxykinase (ATP) [Acetobacteraceae bacterium]